MVVEKQNGGFFRSPQHPFLFHPLSFLFVFHSFPFKPHASTPQMCPPESPPAPFTPQQLSHSSSEDPQQSRKKTHLNLWLSVFFFPFSLFLCILRFPKTPKPHCSFSPHLTSCPVHCVLRREERCMLSCMLSPHTDGCVGGVCLKGKDS